MTQIQPNIPSPHSFCNKLVRVIWYIVYVLFFRPSPKIFHRWRIMLLRLFGARIGKKCRVYPTAKIWLPSNLIMEHDSCIAGDVDCYNVASITIGANSIVSQYSYLCAASHDITKPEMPLITAPIVIEDQVWIAARCYIRMGVRIGQGSVVGACSVVMKDVEPWTVVGGYPAKFIKKRELK